MNYLKTLGLGMMLFHLAPTYADEQFDNGKELHQAQCTQCHDSSVYTRADRKITSLPDLGKRVRLCKNNIGIQWFDDEVNDVIHYLNRQYYKF